MAMLMPRGSALSIYAYDALGIDNNTITNKSLASNVATLTTGTAHGYSVGDAIMVSGVDDTFNGAYIITTVPTTTTFTYAKTASTVNSTAVSPVGAVLTSARWNKITEHNRSEFTITPNRIESVQRMANGSLRKYFIADKKEFSLSWDMLPAYRSLTVDGAWGTEDLREFYSSDKGRSTFKIRVNLAKNGANQESSGFEEYTVSIKSCSFILLKRGIQPHWNVSLTMEEV